MSPRKRRRPSRRSLIDAFDERFLPQERYRKLSITRFAREWCGMELLLWQRVVLKLYAGEALSERREPGYSMSESEWFERQLEAGRLPPDTRSRVRRNPDGFRSILLVVGRRAGKSVCIAIAALYKVHEVLQHYNPQRHYGIQDNDVIQIAVAATTAAQSERSPFEKIRAICKQAIKDNLPLARWIADIQSKSIHFRTRHDMEVEESLKSEGIDQRSASVQIHAYHSNVDSLRGGQIIAAIFDEFAQFRLNQRGLDTAEYFYNTLVASTVQFGKDGRTFILSTPQGEQGKFYELYRETWAGIRESTIGLKMPTWEAWECEPPERPTRLTRELLSEAEDVSFSWNPATETFEEAYSRAPSSFKMEFGAEFVGSDEQWLPSILIDHPQGKGLIDRSLSHVTDGIVGRCYVVHCDAATKTDAFALCVLHKESTGDGERIVVDHLVRWYVAPTPFYQERPYEFVIRQKGPEPAQIYFREVREYIKREILGRFGVLLLTFDQFNSHSMVEELTEHVQEKGLPTMVDVVHFTREFNRRRADNFEALLLEGRIKCYPHPLFQEELKGLVKDAYGRVQKGPGYNDDLYDAVSTAAYNAMDLPETFDQGMGQISSLSPSFPQTRL